MSRSTHAVGNGRLGWRRDGRWKDLFNGQFDVLLYDLTSTSCESDPVFGEPPRSEIALWDHEPKEIGASRELGLPVHGKSDKRKFGYSRDKRPDCVQVVIALVVTAEGFRSLA